MRLGRKKCRFGLKLDKTPKEREKLNWKLELKLKEKANGVQGEKGSIWIETCKNS